MQVSFQQDVTISPNKFDEGTLVAVLHDERSDESIIWHIIGQSGEEIEL